MYKDRGIIKWAPFDALIGFHQLISEIIYNRNKIDHPILLEDKLEELNQTFNEVLEKKLEANYKYYKNGYIIETYGFVVSFDELKKVISLDNGLKIKIDDVTSIQIIDN